MQLFGNIHGSCNFFVWGHFPECYNFYKCCNYRCYIKYSMHMKHDLPSIQRSINCRSSFHSVDELDFLIQRNGRYLLQFNHAYSFKIQTILKFGNALNPQAYLVNRVVSPKILYSRIS